MGDVTGARKRQVQTLRRLARKCDVQAVRDDARKEKVEELALELSRSRGLADDEKKEAATALADYLKTLGTSRRRQCKPLLLSGCGVEQTRNSRTFI